MATATAGLEKRSGLRSVLEFAWVYEAFQRSVGKNKLRRELVDRYFGLTPGDRLLDFGCGPGDLVPFVPSVSFTGYDISTAYIDAARDRFGSQATFHDGSLDELQAAEEPFDVAISIGVLHHIPDDIAHESLRAIAQLLKPGGRFIAIEPHLVADQHWIASTLIKLDRGQFVRSESAYAELLRESFDTVEFVRDDHLLRVPYTLTVYTCQTPG